MELEVTAGGALWTSVCDMEWGMEDAQVVCQQLGYTAAIGAPVGAFYGEVEGKISMQYAVYTCVQVHMCLLCMYRINM